MQGDSTRRALSEVTSDLLEAAKIEAVWDLFVQAMRGYGFDWMVYAGTRFPGRRFLGNLEEALILQEGPREYVDTYIGDELYLYSPSVAWAEAHKGFASWPEAARLYAGHTPTPEQMRIVELNMKFGIVAGYVGSFNGVVPGMNGVIGISAAQGLDQAAADEIWARDGKEIETLANLMHLRVASLPATGLLRPLTTRQREALDWYSQGKTAQDIGVIMGLSIGTIEKHLRSARESLNADTTAHAVKKATSLNLLSA